MNENQAKVKLLELTLKNSKRLWNFGISPEAQKFLHSLFSKRKLQHYNYKQRTQLPQSQRHGTITVYTLTLLL